MDVEIIDLEIRIKPQGPGGTNPVVVRMEIPGDDFRRPEVEGVASFDFAALRLAQWFQAEDYGRKLTAALFADRGSRRRSTTLGPSPRRSGGPCGSGSGSTRTSASSTGSAGSCCTTRSRRPTR